MLSANSAKSSTVTIVWMVVVACRRACVVWIIVPGTTAQHAGLVSGNPAEQQSAGQVWLLLGGNAKNARAATRRTVNSKPARQRSVASVIRYSMGDKHNTRNPTWLSR